MCPTKRYPNSQKGSRKPSSRDDAVSSTPYHRRGRNLESSKTASRPNVVESGNHLPTASRGLRSSERIDQIRSNAAQGREAQRTADSSQGKTTRAFEQPSPKRIPASGRGTNAPQDARPIYRRSDSRYGDPVSALGNNRILSEQSPLRPSNRSTARRSSTPQSQGRRETNYRRNSTTDGSPTPFENVRTRNRANRSERKRTPISPLKIRVGLALILVLLIAGGIDSLINGDRIYAGVKIGDVSVAGMTKEEASSAVSAQYAERVASNVDIFFATQHDLENPKETDTDSNIEQQISYEQSLAERTQWTVTGNEVDAELNIAPLVEEAFEVGRSNLGPVGRLLSTVFGYSIEPECSFNDSSLDSLCGQMTAAIGTKRVNYDIKVENGVASVTDGNEGDEVTRQWLVEHLNDALLSADQISKDVLETEHLALQIKEADAQKVADTVNRSISAGVVFVYEDQSWNASRSEIGEWVITSLLQDGNGWKLQPSFSADSAKHKILNSLHSNLQEDNLTVSFDKSDDGTISVSTTAQGSVPLASEAISQMNETFFTGQERTEAPRVEVQSASIPSTLSLEDAYSFGLIGEISSFTTQYSSGAEARVNNIHTAANLLNNSICKAGEKWSFNDIAGEATEDKGYQNAHAIVSGSYSDAIGGGICQVATTVFNSVYLAGYPVPKRYNHTLYIESYPKGRDAAIAYPDMDLVWRNDTSSDVLLVMSYTSTSVTCTLVGVSPQYQVSTEYGEWQAGQTYSTTYKTDDTLASGKEYVESTGVDGSSITIVRTVKDRSGNVLHTDEFTSNYSPKNKVIVKGTA